MAAESHERSSVSYLRHVVHLARRLVGYPMVHMVEHYPLKELCHRCGLHGAYLCVYLFLSK